MIKGSFFCHFIKLKMNHDYNLKFKIIFLSIIFLFYNVFAFAEEEEIYLKAISDQIQVITKDLKTLEKAVYQKSDVVSSSKLQVQ